MKKIAYTQPMAEMVLLLEDDVIRTSNLNKITDEISIDIVPTKTWQS
ncbi:MAG: hypothetical protein J6B71_00875 [Clostridia bacterium]|nr:hypothetical protein [Clostridia bacterium]